MNKLGKFIVVEGLEGAGKTSVIQIIKQYLEKFSINAIVTREPGGTRIGEMIRKIIKEKSDEGIDPYCELLLFYAARTQLFKQVIEPALQRGTWVLADRFELSTFAYQGGGRQLDLRKIATISKICLNNVKPNLIFFLDLTPEQGLYRAMQRNQQLDRIEQESSTFFHNVYKTYKRLIATMDNVCCIDASKPLKIVQEKILQELKAFNEREHTWE